MQLQLVQNDLLHDFAWVADEADCSVVMALLQVAFLGMCDDRAIGPWGRPSCLPNLDVISKEEISDCSASNADSRESSDYILSTCMGQFCWDVVDSR